MKTIIVNLTGLDATKSALSMAIAIAERCDAHLVGLFVEYARLAMTGLYGWGSAYVYEGSEGLDGSYRKKLEGEFIAACERSGVTHEFRAVRTQGKSPLDAITAHSRLCDLFVVGAETERHGPLASQADFFTGLVSWAGRPVLIVPEDIDGDPQFFLAKVGWDGSREAARAAFDAVPLLSLYDGVRIITANVDPAFGPGYRASQKRLHAALTRHGIDTSTRLVAGKGSDHTVLEKESKEADLLVIGAFNHNRLREQLFGGTTFNFCKQPPCPVLLAR